MVLNDLLDLGLKLRVHVTLRNLAEERSLGLEVLTEVGLPLGDLVNGDVVELHIYLVSHTPTCDE
jgi:hypothetical protein